MKSLNPLKLFKNLENVYVNYLKVFFETRYKDLNNKISDVVDKELYIKGPYLQLSLEYEKGKTIEELIDEGILHPKLKDIYPNLHLRKHQENVILNVVKERRNTIISTGTASGKTKAFLIPVFDYILKLKDKLASEGKSTKGVKAIFLYPMNALVNDQLEELREVLKGSGITFGRYTGDTPYNNEKTRKKSIKKSCQEELLTREEILSEIPDILITNYSMLEFLLLRPKDSPLFEGGLWKFIVLDEIHVYDGAKGTEISYLLKRLKLRAFKEKPICIGASATMGKGTEEDLNKIVKFATKLFGEKFEKQDIILAKYFDYEKFDNTNNLWYEHLDFIEILEKYYEEKIDTFKEYLLTLKNIDEVKYCETKEEALFEFFKNFEGYKLIREHLKSKKVVLLDEFIASVSTKYEPPIDKEQLLALIDLLYKSKKKIKGNDVRLLDVKFHIFIRSLEGIFATINENLNWEEVFTYKKLIHNDRKVFQLATCRNCGEVFLTGYKKVRLEGKFLEIEPELFEDPFKLDIEGKRTFIYLSKNPIEEDNDIDFKVGKDGKEIDFCLETGEIKDFTNLSKPYYAYELTLEDSPYNQPKKCPSCGIEGKQYKKGRWVSFFTPPDEYPQAVSLEAIYKELIKVSENKKERKIIVFSDSRKDASFFAPFFQRFYNDRLNSQIIYNMIAKHKNDISLEILTKKCTNCELSIFYEPVPESKREKTLEKYKKEIIKDFMFFNDEALENIGLIRYRLDKNIEKNIINGLSNTKLGKYLNKDELRNLIYYFFFYIRNYKFTNNFYDIFSGIIKSIWKEGNIPISGDKRFGITRWVPQNINKTNYPYRLLRKILPQNVNGEEIKEFLREIFKFLIEKNKGIIFTFSTEKGFFLDEEKTLENWLVKNVDEVYRCDTCRKVFHWNVKNVCPQDRCNGKLEKLNVKEIYKAKYILNLFENESFDCREIINKKVIVEEHTAQLSTEYGREIQDKFKNGDVNILSCSTTFELGVDLGELQIVYMHNIPPKADNYVQRAGRAGRSSNSAGIIISYALNRPHDLKVFENPIKMIKGEIKPPVIKENNKRIILRHINALALSHYLRNNFTDSSITVSDFREGEHFKGFVDFMNSRPSYIKEEIKQILNDENLIDEFGVETWQWWDGKITSVEDYNSKALFEKIYKELEDEINELNDILDRLEKEETELKRKARRKGLNNSEGRRLRNLRTEISIYEDNLNEIYNQNIITFFSRKVFIPKYGFPVDVASLDIKGAIVKLEDGKEKSFSSIVQLDRGLDMAISEYVPGELIIASKKLVMSTNVKIFKNDNPIEESSELYNYFYCKKCLYFEDGRKSIDYKECPNCGNTDSLIKNEKYLIPRGFEVRNILDLLNVDYKNNVESIFNRKIFNEIKKLSRGQKLFIPVGNMDRDFKPINLSRRQAFFASKGVPFKEQKEVNGFKLEAYMRGTIVMLNISKGRMVDMDRGISYDMYNETWRKRRLRNKFVNLGYRFYTDVLFIEPPLKVKLELIEKNKNDKFSLYLSLLYAILEGASSALDIKREDINGMIRFNNQKKDFHLILYDNVPAGAGFIDEIYENFEEVLYEAKNIVNNCNCDTVCHVCLLHPSNQFYAGKLRRKLAKSALDLVF